MDILKRLASLLVIIGALNWGLVGIFDFNLVTEIFGAGTTLTKVIYTLVGVSGLWMAVNMFNKRL